MVYDYDPKVKKDYAMTELNYRKDAYLDGD
jgi:hypothetical protein